MQHAQRVVVAAAVIVVHSVVRVEAAWRRVVHKALQAREQARVPPLATHAARRRVPRNLAANDREAREQVVRAQVVATGVVVGGAVRGQVDLREHAVHLVGAREVDLHGRQFVCLVVEGGVAAGGPGRVCAERERRQRHHRLPVLRRAAPTERIGGVRTGRAPLAAQGDALHCANGAPPGVEARVAMQVALQAVVQRDGGARDVAARRVAGVVVNRQRMHHGSFRDAQHYIQALQMLLHAQRGRCVQCVVAHCVPRGCVPSCSQLGPYALAQRGALLAKHSALLRFNGCEERPVCVGRRGGSGEQSGAAGGERRRARLANARKHTPWCSIGAVRRGRGVWWGGSAGCC